MGGECDGSCESELCRSVRPDLVKDLIDASPTRRERGHEPLFALEAVSDVPIQFRDGVRHQRPVARTEHLELVPTKPLNAIKVGPHRSRIRGDENAPFAENSIAGEGRGSGDEGEVVSRMAGREDHRQRANDAAPSEQDVDLAARCRHRGPGVALAQGSERSGVVHVVVRERYPTQTSTLTDFLLDRRHMLGEVRPRVHQPRGRSAYQPRVRA